MEPVCKPRDVHTWRPLDEGLVSLLRVLPRHVAEETRAERLANLVGVSAARFDGPLVPGDRLLQLRPDLLGSAHGAGLLEVFLAPLLRVPRPLPRPVHF